MVYDYEARPTPREAARQNNVWGGSVNAWPAFVRHFLARAHMRILIEIALVLVAA